MQLIHSLQPFIRSFCILVSVLYVTGRAGYRDVLLAALTQGVFVRQLIRQAQKPESSCKFSRTFI